MDPPSKVEFKVPNVPKSKKGLARNRKVKKAIDGTKGWQDPNIYNVSCFCVHEEFQAKQNVRFLIVRLSTV